MSDNDEIIVEIKKPEKNKKIKKKRKKVKKVSTIKEARKKTSKFRKVFLKVSLLLIVLFIALIILAMSEIFNIKEISVSGVDKLSENEIISFSQIQIEQNIFKTNLGKAKKLILKNPYVKDVSIKRKLPGKIEINVNEKKAKYIIQFAESYIYLDGQGYILEISKEKPELPILLGILTDLSDFEIGSRLEIDDLKKINTLNQIVETARNYEVLSYITKIDITDINNFILYLDNEGKTAYIGDASNLNIRMLWLKEIIAKNAGKSGKIFIDMDLNNKKPYFRQD